jgi:4'-phosphopantetheinyl transferase
MITVYYAQSPDKLDDLIISAYLNLFPAEVENKIRRFRRWQDAQASLLGKILLKKGLEDLCLNSSLKDLKYTKYGRPYLENALSFNISHSGPYIVCAFSGKGVIGADIEQMDPIRIEDFQMVFNDEEWSAITNFPNLSYAFYYYWTAKEAILKADGRGLSIPLNALSIEKARCCFDNKIWHYKTVSLFDNCILQIASDNQIEEVSLVEVKVTNPEFYCGFVT